MSISRSTIKADRLMLIGADEVGKSTLFQYLSKNFQLHHHDDYSCFIDKNNSFNTLSTSGIQICDLHSNLIQKKEIHYWLWTGKIAFLIFDLTKPDSLKTLEDLMQEARNNKSVGFVRLVDTVTYVLVGNKADLIVQRKISPDQIKQTAKKLHINDSLIFEISAKHGNQVDLDNMVKESINYHQQLHPQPIMPKKTTLNDLLQKHKRKIVLALTTVMIASAIITITAICWPAIIALPFMVAAGVAIASLGLGITASSTATATLAGIAISIIGVGLVTAGTWLANKLSLPKKISPVNSVKKVQHAPGYTGYINAALDNADLLPTKNHENAIEESLSGSVKSSSSAPRHSQPFISSSDDDEAALSSVAKI